MQNNITLKHFTGFLRKTWMLLCVVLLTGTLSAQTVSTASGTNYNGDYSINNPSPLIITFVVENTTAAPLSLFDVSSQLAPYFGTTAGTVATTKLYYSTTSLSGVFDVSTAAWTLAGTGTATVPAALAVTPVISGLNVIIPPATQYRFALEVSSGLAFSVVPAPTPNSFTNGGVTLKVGSFSIGGSVVGYAGVTPASPAGNSGAFFGGSVTLGTVVPCTGTPAPGNTVSSSPSVCPASSFTLSLQNPPAPGTTGLTYQWQSSATGTAGSFTNIAGATGATYSTTQTAATFYQAIVTCTGNGTATSTPVQVLLTPPSSCYCAAGATSTAFEKIANVTLNTINNTTTSTAGYENFTSISTPLEPGRPYPLSLRASQPFAADQMLVWIDFNQNGSFTDPGEAVYTSPAGFPTNGIVTGTIIVPFTALPGTTRMRVRLHDTSLGANPTSCGNSTYGQVEDYNVNILPVVPCTGTPTPGNTISNVNTACVGTIARLSLQNFTSGSGVTYQWQSSPTGAAGSYTNIAGATTPLYNATITAPTFFQCIVTCTGVSVTSTPKQVLLTAFTGCYCTPAASNCSFDDRIANVTFGSTLNNNSTCSANGYANYIATIAATDVIIGAPNPMRVTVGPGGNEFVGVWIDYNHNALFETTEFTLLGSGNGVTITNNINIPATALLGQTGMRVRVNYNAALTGTQACTTLTFGETEDYLVNIIPCVPIVLTSQPANSTIACGNNTSFSVTTTGSLPAVYWEYRTSATTPWLNVPNTAPYSGVNTATLTLTNIPVTFTGYQYRAVYSGACTAVDFSTVATLTVTPYLPPISPVPAALCAGSSLRIFASPPPTVTAVSSGTVNIPIPDGVVAGISNSVVVSGIPAGATITDISVKLNVTHTYVSDLELVVKAPNGQVLNLSNLIGGGNNPGVNFTNTIFSSNGTAALASGTSPGYTGIFRPDAAGAVGAFGVPGGPTGFTPTLPGGTLNDLKSVPNGTWTIAMYDAGPPDVGTLNEWSVSITWGVTPATAVFSPNTNLFLNAALTVPYTGTSVNSVYTNTPVSTTYTAVVSNGTCTANATIPVTVFQPLTNVVAPVNKSVCVGGTVSFTASATGGPASYTWEESADGGATYTAVANGGIFSGATTGTLTLTGVPDTKNGNRYRATLRVATCNSVVTTTAATLTVNPTPIVNVGANPYTALFPGLTTTLTAAVSPNAAATYTWYRNGVVVPGALTNTLTGITVDAIGDYYAVVNDVNGCTGTSNTITIKDSASSTLFIYPNPTNNGVFHVRYYDLPDLFSYRGFRTLTVFDSKGARVINKVFSASGNYTDMLIDISNYGQGIYSIDVTDNLGNRLKTGRVIYLR